MCVVVENRKKRMAKEESRKKKKQGSKERKRRKKDKNSAKKKRKKKRKQERLVISGLTSIFDSWKSISVQSVFKLYGNLYMLKNPLFCLFVVLFVYLLFIILFVNCLFTVIVCCLFVCLLCSCSSSEESDSDKEPVTSTVPELETEAIPPEIKSNRPSWLYRRSRTPSPAPSAERRVVSTTTRHVAGSYNPNIVNRKNEVCYYYCYYLQ